MIVEHFFELTFDENDNQRWELEIDRVDTPECWMDAWAFTDCKGYDSNVKPVECIVSYNGYPRAFNIATLNIPIVSKRFGDVISILCDGYIQRIPVVIENHADWEILKILHCVECLDYKRSSIDYYPADLSDPWIAMNPEKAGCPRGVRNLRVEHKQCAGKVVFRIRKWEVPIIVSESLKRLIEQEGLTGVKFIQV